ncbi:MAG: alpha/beta hydrolase [Paracoccaceae bacterium]
MTRKLNFAERPAQGGAARSLVIFLHGYGADGADLLGLADVLAPHLPGTVFAAPDAPDRPLMAPYGYQWFPIPRFDGSTEAEAKAGLLGAAADLDAFIDARLVAHGLGDGAMALVGFSQGAMMALHVAPRRAKAMAGVVAISGRLMDPEALAGAARVKPPVLVLHGDQDEVVPFAEMARAGNALTRAGFETFGHVMQGSGHGIAPDGLSVALRILMDKLPA